MHKYWYQFYVVVVTIAATLLSLYTSITPIFVPLMLGAFLAFFVSDRWPFFWVVPLTIYIPLLQPQYYWGDSGLLLEVLFPLLALMVILVVYQRFAKRMNSADFLNSIVILAIALWVYREGVYWIMNDVQDDVLFFYSSQIPRMFEIVAYNISYVLLLALPVTWLHNTLGDQYGYGTENRDSVVGISSTEGTEGT